MPHPLREEQQEEMRQAAPPLPPRSHPKQTPHSPAHSAPFLPSSHLKSFLHSSLPSAPLPSQPSPSPSPSASPSLPSAPSSFSRASTAPPSSSTSTTPSPPSRVAAYPYPTEATYFPAPSAFDLGAPFPSTAFSTLPPASPTSPRSPAPVTTKEEEADSSAWSLPALTRLAGAVTIPFTDVSYWTEGQSVLQDEIHSQLRSFGSRGNSSSNGNGAVRASNAALQRLVNSASESGNLRRLLLVLCYHLRHLIDAQRKHEARIQHRRSRARKLLTHSMSTPGTALPPAADSVPSPLPPHNLSSASSFPGDGHWLLCLMFNVRLLLQTLLERLPCHQRELFFQHLRRRPDIAASQSSRSPRQPDYADVCPSPLPEDAPPLSRSRSCDDVATSTQTLSGSDEHHISIPLPAPAGPHPTQDRGEDVLRMLLSTLMQGVVHVPVAVGSEALHGQLLALLFCILEAHDVDDCDVHSGDDGDDGGLSHRTFLEPLHLLSGSNDGSADGSKSKEPAPSKLAFRFMHALLLHFSLRASRDEDGVVANNRAIDGGQSSGLQRLFDLRFGVSSLSSLVSQSIQRSLRFFFPPSTDFPLADQSALLSLWMSYQMGSSSSLASNTLRHVLGQLRDGMDRRGRVCVPAESDEERLSFDALYHSLALTSGREWSCVFLFHLLNVNVAFRRFVIAHPQLDSLLLPLLHVLYSRVELTHNWTYMVINSFLVLSQEPDFQRVMHERRVEEQVPWFIDAKLHSLSMHDLVLIVLLRLLRKNLDTDQGCSAYNNALAALANMAAAPTPKGQDGAAGSLLSSAPVASALSAGSGVLHPYAAYLLVSLFCSACQRMTEQLHAALYASSTRSITSLDQIPASFNVLEAVGALCLDVLVHVLLPCHLLGHASALWYMCTDDARTQPLRLQRVLEASRVRVFQHVAEADDGGHNTQFDLLANLVDFLAHFPSTAQTCTPAPTQDGLRTFVPHVQRYLRGLRPEQLAASSTHPFPFDPLLFRGHYVYEERDNSCSYFWPHFRVFAARMGVGRAAGRSRDGEDGIGDKASEGETGPSEEEIRQILESFEDGGDYDDL